jgi:hypothetical protein
MMWRLLGKSSRSAVEVGYNRFSYLSCRHLQPKGLAVKIRFVDGSFLLVNSCPFCDTFEPRFFPVELHIVHQYGLLASKTCNWVCCNSFASPLSSIFLFTRQPWSSIFQEDTFCKKKIERTRQPPAMATFSRRRAVNAQFLLHQRSA